MAKKPDRGEPKKECPSCGLGVSLESNICEFCGWDFQEEDEWILQIEKLERDLMLEKQKFKPGTVDHRIESTLVSPLHEKTEAPQGPASAPEPEPREEPKVIRASEYMIDREGPGPTPEPEMTHHAPVEAVREPEPIPEVEPAEYARQETPTPKVRKVRNVPQPTPSPEPVPEPAPPPHREVAASPPMRKVRQPIQEEPVGRVEPGQPVRKVRTVRKVKG